MDTASPCSEIVCCCHGWERESWNIGPQSYDDGTAGIMRIAFARSRIFWWWTPDLSRQVMVVADGDPEPIFSIPENLPFRVLKCSIHEIAIHRIPNA
jgi:hypothetical protein